MRHRCSYETWAEREQQMGLPVNLRNCFNVWAHAAKGGSVRRASRGLVTVVKKVFSVEIVEVSHWWCFVRIASEPWHAVVTFFYFSPALDMSVLLEMLQPTLNEILARFPDDIIILGGDFNAGVDSVNVLPEEIFEETLLFKTRESYHKVVNNRGP